MFSFFFKTSGYDVLYIARDDEFDSMNITTTRVRLTTAGEQVRSHISSSEGHRSLPAGNPCGAQVTLRRT